MAKPGECTFNALLDCKLANLNDSSRFNFLFSLISKYLVGVVITHYLSSHNILLLIYTNLIIDLYDCILTII